MKISELIVKLEEVLNYDGDLVVKVGNLDRDFDPVESVWLSSNTKENYVVIT